MELRFVFRIVHPVPAARPEAHRLAPVRVPVVRHQAVAALLVVRLLAAVLLAVVLVLVARLPVVVPVLAAHRRAVDRQALVDVVQARRIAP